MMFGMVKKFWFYQTFAKIFQLKCYYHHIFANKFELVNATNTIEQCTNSLYNWLSQNGLALKPSKSEAIQFRTAQTRSDGCATVVNVAGENIVMSPSIKSLGVLPRLATFFWHPCSRSYESVLLSLVCCKTHPSFSSRRSRKNGCVQYYQLATRLLQLTSRRDVRKQLC